MCGLGDKDRRQISPAPFLKLHVFQDQTEITDIENFDVCELALLVELWTSDQSEDVSLFPRITSPTSSSSSRDRGSSYHQNQKLEHLQLQHRQQQEENITTNNQRSCISKPLLDSPTILPVSQGTCPDIQLSEEEDEQESEEDSSGRSEENEAEFVHALERSSTPNELSADESNLGIPIRNLIGNVIYNPSKLYDDKNQLGIWFILQDLSIRIEGEFKLRFNLISLDKATIPSDDSTNSSFDDNSLTSSQESAERRKACKTSIFSDVLTVYSAKKYPGVIDNSKNHLAKIFAYQGIKIPIRRDSKSSN